MVSFWKFFESDQNLYITGSSGTGKSCLIWAWCIYARYKISICWIHIAISKEVVIVYLTQDHFTIIIRPLSSNVEEIIRKTTASVLVIDGITDSTKHYVGIANQWRKENLSSRIILISSNFIFSFQFSINEHN